MYLEMLLNVILLALILRQCTSQAFAPPLDQPEYGLYELPTNVSLRETTIDITDYTCSSNGFCNRSLSRYVRNWCFECNECRCDFECLKYGDCCADQVFNSEETVFQPSEYITCHKQYLKWVGGNRPRSIFMYTLCPNEFIDNDMKIKCEQPSKYNINEVTLVSAGDDTYRNQYCAMCHGHMIYTTWRRSVQCQSGDILQSASDKRELWKIVLDDPRCKINPIAPGSAILRKCESEDNLIDKCNISKTWTRPDPSVELLCGMYYHPVKYQMVWYKNIFCAICNGAEILIRQRCNESGTVDSHDNSDGSDIGYPLSVLIDFNPKPRHVFDVPPLMDEETVTRVQCNESSFYDPFSESCRKALCSFGRILSDGDCEVTFQSSSGLGYSGSVSLDYHMPLPWSTWREILKSYSEKLRDSLQGYRPFIFPTFGEGIITRTDISKTPHGPHLIHQTVVRTRVDFQFVSTKSGNQLKLEDVLRKAHELEIAFIHDGGNRTLTTQPIRCQDEPGFDKEKGEEINIEYSSTPDFVLCEENCDTRKVVFSPVYFMIECPFLEFVLSTFNFTLNSNNITLEYDNQTFHLDSYQYRVCGDVLRICSRSLSTIEEKLTEQRLLLKAISQNTSMEINSFVNRVSVSPALAIVSIICIVVSLVCLFLTFIVYCLLPFLRTLPGKNTMVLVVYLFSAQLLFQVGNRLNYDQKLCQAMGVVIHYLWIATFTSMAVCAFHMHNVFTKLSRSTFADKTNDAKKVALYLLVINLVPAAVVGICMAYHAGLSGGLEIGYGGDICFLLLPMDIGIFFAAPLGIILIFNTFCFVRVVMAIRNVPDMKTSKNKVNRNHSNVYFRLSVLLGFAWIFGFIAAAAQIEALWYVFIVLNGLQGVFLFLSYGMNRRTRGMLKETCCCKQSEKYKPSNQMSSPMPGTATSNL